MGRQGAMAMHTEELAMWGDYVNVVTRSTRAEAASVGNDQDDDRKKYAVLKPERTTDSLK